MPKPLYILAAHSSAMDKETGSFSVFECVDKIVAQPIEKIEGPVLIVWRPFQVVAAWMGEFGDENIQFDSEIRVFVPGKDEPIGAFVSTFKFFQPTPDAHIMRFIGKFEHPLPVDRAGFIRIESRIRIWGSDKWLTQEHPIRVEIGPPITPPSVSK
jgi:hypothetical protein